MQLEGVGSVHFVCPDAFVWPELLQDPFAALDPEVLQMRCVNGLDCWVLRTYYELRMAGYTASVGPRLMRDHVNVVGVRSFGRRQRDVGSFVVAPRLDAHHPALANFVIQQNGLTPPDRNSGHIAHWVQPNILPRDQRRGGALKTIVYKGALTNLDAHFRSDSFRNALAAMDVQLVLDSEGDVTSAGGWGDYRQADAVLAVRNLTRYDARYKPASKLVNAWWAEVPALLGPEPAFQELRQSPLDYFEIRSVEDVLRAVAQLKAEPDRYRAMIDNGRQRRVAFSTEQNLRDWVSLFEGKIAQSFQRWQQTSRAGKLLYYSKGVIMEPLSKRSHHRKAVTGARILD